jgi:hypothetical protein
MHQPVAIPAVVGDWLFAVLLCCPPTCGRQF